MLLDLGLPDVDGVDVCREIRAACDVPVIVVSARGEVNDRIQGLDCGADDYLVKPFDTGELLARMHAVLRRRARRPCPATGATPSRWPTSAWTCAATRSPSPGNWSRSPARSSRSSRCSRRRAARCTRGRIVAEVWGRSWPGANRTLDVHVATLRTKLGRRSWWRRCAGSATGSASPTGRPARPRPRSRAARGCW